MQADTSPKLLVLAYKAPPVQTPGSQRIYNLVRQLNNFFGAIWVLKSENNQHFRQDEALTWPATIKAYNIPTKDLRSRAAWQKAHLGEEQKNNYWYQHLAPLYRAYPFVRFTGDGGHTYIKQSVKWATQLIKEEGITHLFSSYRPWADHIIASRLKQKFPHLIWIADFRDLAVDQVRQDVWWPGLQLRFQQRILQKAKLVTTVSEGLAKHLRKYHANCIVVRNGTSATGGGFMTAPISNRFTISYTGSLYPKLQSAHLLLQNLRKMLDEGVLHPYHLELHYAGKDGAVWRQWLIDHGLVHFNNDHGLLPIAAVRTLQKNSQLNLLLSWSAKDYGGIMTAKLGDYLAAGRPIVGLINGPADEELNLLIEQTGSGYVYPSEESNSSTQLYTFLLDAYRSWQFSGALPWRSNSQLVEQYTWKKQADNLIKVLKSL
ncbi:MAG: hypothetical protein AAGJ93_07770 [Bacteroidota bacterium]